MAPIRMAVLRLGSKTIKVKAGIRKRKRFLKVDCLGSAKSAEKNITEISLNISDGWIFMGPRLNQRLAPRTFTPKPGIRTAINKRIQKR